MRPDRGEDRASRTRIGFISTWPVYWGTTIDRHAHALMRGIHAAALDRDCDLLLGAGMSGQAERTGARTVWPVPGPDTDFVPVGPWNTDGLIIVPDDLSDAQSQYVEDLRESGFPLVFTTPEAPGPQVVVDNASGIAQAVRHLFDHGHRDIAFVAGKSRRGGDSAERLRAFRDAMAALGLDASDDLIAYGEHRFEGGRAAMTRILEHRRPFTAVVSSNDLSCLGAMEVLLARGLRVPEDVATIGFDDILDATASTPSLTTVRHPTYSLGYQAVITLLDHIEGRAAPLRTVVPTQLVVRESCGCGVKAVAASAPETQTTRVLLEHMDMMSELGFLTAQLGSALEVEEIGDILARRLPTLGVEHLFVALYDPRDDGDPNAFAEPLICTGVADPPRRRFRSRSYPPPESYPGGAPIQVVVLPLGVGSQAIGFVALPAANLEAAAAVASNLAAAMRTSRLYREALEGRRLAEEASRLKSRFLSMVSHELRTPLSIVVGTTDLVLREARDAGSVPPHIVADLERMAASAQHLGRLIGDVLDLASGEAGELGIIRRPLDLAEVIAEAAATAGPLVVERGLEWRSDVPSRGPWVLGDRTRLRQVLLNLLTNAVKFTDAGSISLTARTIDGRVTVDVTDTGIGVRPEDQERVFEEFQRGQGAAARSRGGLGLGLAIARQLVELHGGSIELRPSGDRAGGTTVSFSLPTMTGIPPHPGYEEPGRVALESVARLAADEMTSGSTILVVDDDAEIVDLHARILAGAGARVAVATNGREALLLIEELQPDLVLLDLGMPEMDGFELVDALRAKAVTRDLPIIVVTGQSLADPDLDRLNQGVATVMRKGVFKASETLDRVEAALTRRRALGGPTQRLVRSAMAFIEANCVEPLTRDDIARAISISPDYLTDCFRQELGVTPMVYLNRCRIQLARHLLETTDDAITSIALSVGFSDVSHFTRTFHREVAVSPRAYRRGGRAPR